MGHRAYFYNSKKGDRKYNAESFMEWLIPFFTTGVFNNCFEVTANNNMTVTVSGGYANVGGRVVVYDSAEVFNLAKANGNMARKDNVILRRDDTNRDIYLMIQTGTFSNNPTAPDLVRENAIYDLKLAEIYVGVGVIVITQANIDDTRMNPDVCGWVMATVKEIDFTQITAQFDAFFAEYTPRIESDYTAFTTLITERYGQYLTFTGNHENEIDARYLAFIAFLNAYKTDSTAAYEALIVWLESFKASSMTEFETWLVTIKDILDDETAGHLLLMIQELQSNVPTVAIGTIDHGLNRYPAARLYKVDYAAGVGGAGEGGAGGGNLISIPAEFELDGNERITVKTIPEFVLHTEMFKISENTYGFVRAGSETSLFLILD